MATKSIGCFNGNDNGDDQPICCKSILLAVETRYTILVSTVIARVTLITSPANELQQPVMHLRSDNDLINRWSVDRISEATAAAERHE